MNPFDNNTSEFQTEMKQFIRDNFSDILGDNVALLDKPGGLDTLSEMLRDGKLGKNL